MRCSSVLRVSMVAFVVFVKIGLVKEPFWSLGILAGNRIPLTEKKISTDPSNTPSHLYLHVRYESKHVKQSM